MGFFKNNSKFQKRSDGFLSFMQSEGSHFGKTRLRGHLKALRCFLMVEARESEK